MLGESNVTRNVTKFFGSVKIMTNLMNLACLVIVQSNLSLNRRNVIHHYKGVSA
jgi:hypothetical protein